MSIGEWNNRAINKVASFCIVDGSKSKEACLLVELTAVRRVMARLSASKFRPAPGMGFRSFCRPRRPARTILKNTSPVFGALEPAVSSSSLRSQVLIKGD